MKRGLDRATQSSLVGNGRERDGALLSTTIMPPSSYYDHDTSDRSNNSQDCNGGGGGCLGGWISSILGGGGLGDGEGLLHNGPAMTQAIATNTTANDDPTLLVADELNKLSLQDREVVYEDLHGVSMVEDESNQELVNKRLMEMKLELDSDNIPRSKKVAYLIAMEEFGEIGKQFCHDRSLLLMFLRADRWDSKKAATRFVGWLDWKLELFGRDVLCHRHVTMDKLDKEAISAFSSGRGQLLPQRDTSGRTVLFDWIGYQSDKFVHGSLKSMKQFFWYLMMATIEDDVQAQRLGIVYILYGVDGTLSFNSHDRNVFLDCSRMAPMLPVRINSMHYCYNDPRISPVITLIQKTIGSHIRARFCGHKGNHTEVQYSLMTYGVPVSVLPIGTNDKIKTTNLKRWYKRRKVRDSTLANRVGGARDDDFYGVDIPGRYDVLLGKGKPIQQHLGNRRLLELLPIYCQEYLAATHGNKQLIAEKIVKTVQESSSSSSPLNLRGHVGSSSGAPRFLKQGDDGWWVPATDAEAIDKVCRSIRAFLLSEKGSTTMTSATRPTTTMTVVHDEETGEILNPVSTSSSTTGNGPTTAAAAATKRVKVETPNVLDSENPMLQISSDPSLSIWKEENEDLNSLDGATTTTTKEDTLLDLDGSDWDNNWDII